MSTIPTLWPTVQRWLADNPQHVAEHPLLPAFLQAPPREQGGSSGDSSGGGGGGGGGGGRAAMLAGFQRAQYSGAHMWSNFEIGRLAFFRGAAYRSYFAHLEAAGGFFYERCAARGGARRAVQGVAALGRLDEAALKAGCSGAACDASGAAARPRVAPGCSWLLTYSPFRRAPARLAARRWGDAPVHTLAAAAILDRRQVRFAEDIGYHHGSWSYW